MSKERHEPFGRPSIYSEELADKICQIVATNPDGLPKLCKRFDEMPAPDTIRQWRWTRPDFSSKYAEAKRFQAELMAESTEEIIDELSQYEFCDKDGAVRLDSGMVARARLLVDSRKWHASKLAPKIYGDKANTEQANESNAKEVAEHVAKIIKESEKEY
jgi:hypothetical protein